MKTWNDYKKHVKEVDPEMGHEISKIEENTNMEDAKPTIEVLWESSTGRTFLDEVCEGNEELFYDRKATMAGPGDTIIWLDNYSADGETERRIKLLPESKAADIVMDAVSKAVKIQTWDEERFFETISFDGNTKQVMTAWVKPTDGRKLVLPDGTYGLDEIKGFFITDGTFRYELKDHAVTVSLADITHCHEPEELAFIAFAVSVHLRGFLMADRHNEFNLIREIKEAHELD